MNNGAKPSIIFLYKNYKNLLTNYSISIIIKLKIINIGCPERDNERRTAMKMIKNLSKVVVRNYPDFKLREDLNFSDDGNYFRGFEYKGLPITTLRTDNRTYCAVRVDYLENDFTFEEWYNTEEYRLADEFNGCDEVDLDKLIENCERIIAKVAELNAKAKNEVIDMTAVVDRLIEEIDIVDEVVEEVKANLKWWKLSDYELRDAKYWMNSLLKERERIYEMDIRTLSRKEKKQMVERLEKYGYVIVKEDAYGAKWLRGYIAKCN